MRNREVSFTADERKALRRQTVVDNFKQAEAALLEAEKGSDEQTVYVARRVFEAARLDLETFDFERDVTGARKGDALGADLNGLYQCMRNADGSVDMAKAKNIHVVQINMGELDRLNKIGGHELGDNALGEVCQRIYAAVENVLNESSAATGDQPRSDGLNGRFEVYRSSGNDFTVLLKEMDEKTASRISSAIAGELPIPNRSPGQGVPLVATHLRMSEVADFWNKNLNLMEGENPGRAFVDAVKEQSQIENDTAKIRSRMDRILYYQPQEDAKTFYDEFLKKSLGGLYATDPKKPLGYEAFLSVCKSSSFDERLDKALCFAMEGFRARQKYSQGFAKTLLRFVLDRWIEIGRLEKKSGEALAEHFEVPGLPVGQLEDVVDDDARQAFLDQLPKTSGEIELMATRNECESLSSAVGPRGKADLLVAEAKRRNVEAKRNIGTGLYERGVLFSEMEKALSEGSPMSVVAIDMAFLKYFNIEGGRKTGDVAIKFAARIMEHAAREKLGDVPYYVCRTGGDEFMIAVATDDQNLLRELQTEIRRLSEKKSAAVPCVDESRTANYRQENLHFNLGSHTAKNLKVFRQELIDAGFKLKAGADDVAGQAKEAADYLTRIADRQVELQKTISRFMFLIRRSFEEESEGVSKGNFESLEDYSLKAIGGEDGQALVRAWKDRLMAKYRNGEKVDVRELEGEITQHVIRRGWEEVEKKEENQEFVDKLLEAEIRKKFLSQRILELQNMVVEMRSQLSQEKENVDHLHKRIKELEHEMESMASLRQRITAIKE